MRTFLFLKFNKGTGFTRSTGVRAVRLALIWPLLAHVWRIFHATLAIYPKEVGNSEHEVSQVADLSTHGPCTRSLGNHHRLNGRQQAVLQR